MIPLAEMPDPPPHTHVREDPDVMFHFDLMSVSPRERIGGWLERQKFHRDYGFPELPGVDWEDE